ncbi:hypothetical protein [Neoaquamicrobium sediminum]|uniref:hypothetical protein n=1 Tax=Neoaquamicrobium sediminum TaxID=1849104 RepID=UPI0015664C92|nr:hypothetical protein [Mesorhizobium sediminum]NRC54145.1 hypothetical protein [Mesorhizobium sediminum]
MSMREVTDRFGFAKWVFGFVKMKQAWEQAAPVIDAHLLPPFTADDIGKTLVIEDDGEGNPVLAWSAA